MLVHRCQPRAVHVSAEPLILSKDTVDSEEIAFYASIALFVMVCVWWGECVCVWEGGCLPGSSDDEAEAPLWVCGNVIRDMRRHECKCGLPE